MARKNKVVETDKLALAKDRASSAFSFFYAIRDELAQANSDLDVVDVETDIVLDQLEEEKANTLARKADATNAKAANQAVIDKIGEFLP